MNQAGADSIIRRAAVLGLAGLLALQVLRTAVVTLPEEHRPDAAASIWPSHPTILVERSMAEIGAAAARGQEVASHTRARIEQVAHIAPLAPEPFLVRGAILQTDGRQADAERLFVEARAREPRSRAARYFLAERYFRTNRIAAGLIEMAALARLAPSSAAPLVPALVAYARAPGAVPQLRAFFRIQPQVEPAVLSVLADDAANADLILALATGIRGETPPEWQCKIVTRLAEAGQYRKARAIWARLTGIRPADGLFNPEFKPLSAPPPFNWSYPTTSDGVAEPAADGRLEVLYYGRQETVLANQLLVLPPGRYALSMAVSSDTRDGSLHWSLRCAGQGAPFFKLQLAAAAGKFDVPHDCPAQWLELRGMPGDFPRTTEATIGRLRLDRDSGR